MPTADPQLEHEPLARGGRRFCATILRLDSLPRYVEGSNREVQTEELSMWVKKKSLAIHLRAVIKEVIKV